MTDYSTQYSSAQLTPINPSQNYSTPLETSPYNYISDNPAKIVNYKTSFMCFGILHPLVFSIVGLAATVFVIIEGMRDDNCPVYASFITFIFFIVGYTLGCLLTLRTKIHIDNSIGIISITKVKTFFWFNVTKIIQINKIQQVEKWNSIIYFIFLNGNKIEGCSFQKRDECYKAFNIIKSGLPQNINFIFNDKFDLY